MVGWDSGIYRAEVREAANQIIWHYVSLLLTPATDYTYKGSKTKITHFKSNVSNGEIEKACFKLTDYSLFVIKSISSVNTMFRCPE